MVGDDEGCQQGQNIDNEQQSTHKNFDAIIGGG
jgi:hypothetical protein